MTGHIRTITAALVAALVLALPASASAFPFPYLTINAAERAINHYQRSWYESEEQEGRWTVFDCDHETLDSVLVWCQTKGINWPTGERWRSEHWEEWNWAELMPSGQIETGSEE